ncbi:MAG: hypothetical protein ACKE5M_08655 [Methylophilaceae bacterium]
MFKKALVSVTLGVLLLFSLSLWAKSNQEPVLVAKLKVDNQLSISAHQVGEESFISQVGAKKDIPAKVQGEKNVPMSLLSVFGVMAFGLIYFVHRSSRQRIK